MGRWRKFHGEELHNFNSQPNTTMAIKSRRMGLAGHVARMGAMRNSYKFLSENTNGRGKLGDLGIKGRIILKYILKKQGVKMTGFMWLRVVSSGGLLWTR
jgi:hypothetical protein